MPKPKKSSPAASPRAVKPRPKPAKPQARVATKPQAGAAAAEVAAFLAACRHARRAELDTLRAIVAAAAPQLVEGIKWNAPSWRLPDGDDCITCNLGAKDRLRLVFHRGAKAKDTRGTGRLVAAEHDWLVWAADDRAVATFGDAAGLATAAPALTALVRAWLRAAGG